MKKLLAIFTALLMAVTLVGCDSNDDGDDEVASAQVRFFHASPTAGAVNILVDGEDVIGQAVSFSQDPVDPTVSGYQDVPLDVDAEIRVTDSEGNNAISPIAVDGLDLDEGEQYTVVVAGDVNEPNAPAAILLGDSGISPSENSDDIKLRLVHGAATLGTVDVFIVPPGVNPDQTTQSETRLIDDLDFGEDFPGVAFSNPGAFAAQPLSGTSVDIVVTDSEDASNVLRRLPVNSDQSPIELTGGEVVTAVAVDTELGGTLLIENPQ